MEQFKITLLSIILIITAGCSKPNYERSIIGTWELTGDRCDTVGQCGKEIITAGSGAETFTADGMYLSDRIRTNYALKGAAIYFASENNNFTTRHADIISIRNGIMLLRFNDGIRRYELSQGKK